MTLRPWTAANISQSGFGAARGRPGQTQPFGAEHDVIQHGPPREQCGLMESDADVPARALDRRAKHNGPVAAVVRGPMAKVKDDGGASRRRP
ncbi:hypothetical protein [Pseudarthrobacter sp. ATCC 49987]|uniref:hypothetical protein n=1 Tax=Pseudarthrobacter sp. ATCC 49987 TaxID=2698204 RepID=UPI00136F3E95|nr:hypothetical protein [Pseudarthrobacter sp. ATCC 49987]